VNAGAANNEKEIGNYEIQTISKDKACFASMHVLSQQHAW